jgi:hypothetical protein
MPLRVARRQRRVGTVVISGGCGRASAGSLELIEVGEIGGAVVSWPGGNEHDTTLHLTGFEELVRAGYFFEG